MHKVDSRDLARKMILTFAGRLAALEFERQRRPLSLAEKKDFLRLRTERAKHEGRR